MADAHRRKFDAVLCWKIDGFGRSLKHLVNALADLDFFKVAFISLKDNLDLSTPSGRLMFQIIGAMAEFERELIQESESARTDFGSEQFHSIERLCGRSSDCSTGRTSLARPTRRRRKELVGTGRFELPTPRTPSECSTRLSHVPTLEGFRRYRWRKGLLFDSTPRRVSNGLPSRRRFPASSSRCLGCGRCLGLSGIFQPATRGVWTCQRRWENRCRVRVRADGVLRGGT